MKFRTREFLKKMRKTSIWYSIGVILFFKIFNVEDTLNYFLAQLGGFALMWLVYSTVFLFRNREYYNLKQFFIKTKRTDPKKRNHTEKDSQSQVKY